MYYDAKAAQITTYDGREHASTGDPRMNAPWTALGTPAISIPMEVRSGLPLGLQLTAEPGRDALLLHTAVRLHRLLR
jgi:Asp-tRNA(Asn)/Glu-tRNA(Gln) amidotransferase A subunit family amidase